MRCLTSSNYKVVLAMGFLARIAPYHTRMSWAQFWLMQLLTMRFGDRSSSVETCNKGATAGMATMTVRTGIFVFAHSPVLFTIKKYPKCNLFAQKEGESKVFQHILNPSIRNYKTQTSELKIRNFGFEVKKDS